MLRNEFPSKYDDIECEVEIGSVCDVDCLRDVFVKYRPPPLVFHAAAHKHVPLMEMCPRESIQNNGVGTLNTVRLAQRGSLFSSSFPPTKRSTPQASWVLPHVAKNDDPALCGTSEIHMLFASGRVGSNGSVISAVQAPGFAAGGPIRAHASLERFFTAIPEASRLVIQAGGRAAKIFIDMV